MWGGRVRLGGEGGGVGSRAAGLRRLGSASRIDWEALWKRALARGSSAGGCALHFPMSCWVWWPCPPGSPVGVEARRLPRIICWRCGNPTPTPDHWLGPGNPQRPPGLGRCLGLGCGQQPPLAAPVGYPPDRGSRHRRGPDVHGRGSDRLRKLPGSPLATSAGPRGHRQGSGGRRPRPQRRGRPSVVRTWIRRTRPGPHSAPRRSSSLPWR